MPLSIGDRLGPYEILAPIGKGGMGEVYRAHDSRLNRDVAIKVSKSQFTERFTREARAIASLNHTNICHLYDVGPNYLVMEYVEGPDLRGPLDFGDALPIIEQLIDGIEAAHDKNIIHRDLKPANIKVTPEGVVKILDFGLAKAMEPPPSQDGRPEDSPTFTLGGTQAGTILGTAAYMAPEQAKGKTADRRADIWSFGVVLYEMLTGQPLFQGESTVEILGAVLNKEPDLSATPTRVHQLLRWCLEKDRTLRLASISDARRLLRAGVEEPAAQPAPAPRSGHRWIPWAVAALFFIAAGLLAGVHFREKPAVAQPVRLQIPVPENLKFNSANPPSVSPDGRWVAFTATGSDGVTRIYLRAMDSLEAKPLPGTDLVSPVVPPPYWSFDSRFLVFASGGKLKKIDILGGPPQSICDLPTLAQGVAWNREGTIIFAGVNTGLQRVSASGGSAVPLTVFAPGETAHRYPQFLPDGRHFLYLRVSSAAEKMGIFVGSIDAKPEAQSTKPLLLSGFQGNYVQSPAGGPGWLLFLREGTLLAQPFDPGKLELSGDPVPVASPVGSFGGPTVGLFSVSENGVLVYRSGSSSLTRLAWRDITGNTLGTLGDPGLYGNPAISPDGRRVAVNQVDSQGNADIWVLDVARGTSTRLTFDPHPDTTPVWSPDGARIAFRSNRAGRFDLYEHNADGSGEDRLLFQSGEDKIPTSWSHDGKFLLFNSQSPKTGADLWILPLAGGGKPIPFLKTESLEVLGQFSPDGRWIAYTSNESGAFEVYVRPVSPNSIGGTPGSGGKWMVSKGGGASPSWRGDGKQLFYLTVNRQLMAVDVTAERTFQAGIPKTLFDSQAASPGTYGVASDGKKFLFVTPQAANAAAPYTVVLNWLPGLKK